MKVWLLLITLLIFLVAAIYFSVDVWLDLGDVALGTKGWVALIGGAVLTLALGGGLMALVFYSSRHGHDDAQMGQAEQREPHAGD